MGTFLKGRPKAGAYWSAYRQGLRGRRANALRGAKGTRSGGRKGMKQKRTYTNRAPPGYLKACLGVRMGHGLGMLGKAL